MIIHHSSLNKKAQIASTLTWMTAFLVIFFIMILFTTSTIILASLKIPKNTINIQNFAIGNYKTERDLESFLVSNINFNNQNTSVFDFLRVSDVWQNKDVLVKAMDKKLNSVANCYYICIDYNDKSVILNKPTCVNNPYVGSSKDQLAAVGTCKQIADSNSSFIINEASIAESGIRVDLFVEAQP